MAAEREAIRYGLDGRREEGARALVARADAAASPDEPADLSELVARGRRPATRPPVRS